jgi:hypothetical protein
MYLFILVLLVGFLVFLLPKRDKDPLGPLKNEAYKYSGLKPELYYSFLNNMKLMQQVTYSVDTSAGYLYKAIDNLQDLALYAKGGSTGLIDEIHELASRIGNAGELIILDSALNQGVRFYPKFIKFIPDTVLPKFCKAYPGAPECKANFLNNPTAPD